MKKISVESALSKAKLCVKRNELLEARKLYQAVLIAFPKNKTARQGLASLNNRKQLGGDQNPPKEITQELITLYNQGRLALVVDKAKALLKLYPRSSIVWNILGTSAAQIGKLSQAIDAFKKTAILQPKDAEPHFNMGTAFQDKGKLAEAVKAYRKALSLKADYAKAFNNMGTALHDQGKLEEALEAYKNVISLKPNDALVIINMGAVLQDLGKLDEAVRIYKNALSINSNDADLYYNLGNALSDQSKLEEAVKAYNNALSIKPQYVEALNNMGTSFRHQGKQKEALSAYNKVLSLDPNHFGAHRNLSTLVTYKKDNPQINKIKELMNHSDLSADSRCLLHYTYAKINEDLGDLEKAFDHYAIGGALRKKQLAYDIGQDQRLFKKIKTVAPKLLEHSLTETVRKLDITPIFILGMPRSGTTLVEQIISCHSQVHGAGELPLL
ncbi:MAG: tetratricopeptide repeat protein, partial [Tateyamaria sp.]|nr:tetratricopeptide repeat protein [Tateyamaria sp.]